MFTDQVGIQIFLAGFNGDEINDTFTVDMHRFPPPSFLNLVAKTQKYSVVGDVLLEKHRNRAKHTLREVERRNVPKGHFDS